MNNYMPYHTADVITYPCRILSLIVAGVSGSRTSRRYWLTHSGRMSHICVSDLTSIGSDNGLSPSRCQAIIRTNAGTLLIRPLGTNFSENLIEILIFSFKKMRLKVSSVKTQAKKAGCFSLQYSPNSHLMHTQCSSNAHLVQGHIFRNFLAIHT